MHTSIVIGALDSLVHGFLLCASLIMVIGPQNMFILQQGLRRRHLFATALISTLADVVLIAVGVGGAGALVSAESAALVAMTSGGACFLLWCGSRTLLAAGRNLGMESYTTGLASPARLPATIAAALSFSLLNPSAYLDTLVIIGTKSCLIPTEHRIIFGFGAVLASACWFFTLTYGASKLSPLFRHPVTWRAFNIVSGCVMVGIAGTMVGSLWPI